MILHILYQLPLLQLLLFVPLGTALLIAIIPSTRLRIVQALAIVSLIATSTIVFVLYTDLDKQPLYPLRQDSWLGLDGLSLPFILLGCVIFAVALLSTIHSGKRQKFFYMWLLLLQASTMSMLLAQYALIFLFAAELAALSFYRLQLNWSVLEQRQNANQLLRTGMIGSVLLLLGFVLTELERAAIQLVPTGMIWLEAALPSIIFFLVATGFLLKFCFMPIQRVVFALYRSTALPVAILHAGFFAKIGLYGLVRFGIEVYPAHAYQNKLWLMFAGMVVLLYGTLRACFEQDIRSMLLYGVLGQSGLSLLGLSAMNQSGWQGGLFLALAHGLLVVFVLLLLDALSRRTTEDLYSLRGLSARFPYLTAMLFFCGLSILSLPGFASFVGVLLSLTGLYAVYPVAVFAIAITILVSSAYMLRSLLTVIYPETRRIQSSEVDVSFAEALPMMLLLAFLLLLGLYPSILSNISQQAIVEAMIRLKEALAVLSS